MIFDYFVGVVYPYLQYWAWQSFGWAWQRFSPLFMWSKNHVLSSMTIFKKFHFLGYYRNFFLWCLPSTSHVAPPKFVKLPQNEIMESNPYLGQMKLWNVVLLTCLFALFLSPEIRLQSNQKRHDVNTYTAWPDIWLGLT